ncbi:PH domain-containing protein [Microbacterium elymi]|uniref:PH domain-containing protein n=1 Tax=Microbacterium elymi TaxID=2909587 RepID=A0ABY5NK34_9MICO|nr:PH domain-containing protein [Microbacterium elymi]UUT35533.1 PH domain-containing protein [Microbacterium elymi]
MTKDLAQGGVIVLRAVSSVITFWALAGLAVIFVGDAAIRGRVELALRAGGVIAFILWCAWVFLIRMSVRVDASALSARNLLRWVRIPWARVADVERRAQLRITLDDGSAVECWAARSPRVRGRGRVCERTAHCRRCGRRGSRRPGRMGP